MGDSMKAVLMRDKGSIDVLQFSDITEPEISTATEVKIRIKAAAINPIDTKVRQNRMFYPEQSLPIVLGCDGAGEIIETGDEVINFKTGDEVWFCNGGLGKEQGNYAEYTVIDSRWLAFKPNNIDFKQAAAMPLVLITAWGALFEKGQLQANETVLIHAGAGGVGHVAIQLAKIKGATVITTVSSKEKAELAISLGADHVINYSQNNFVDEVNRLTNDKGVDLLIDTVGSEVFKQSIAATAYCGRLITLLDPGEVELADARMKNLLIGFELMLTPMLKQLDVARDKQIQILNQCRLWVEQDELKVLISDVLSLQQVAEAHQKIEQGSVTGKIVIEI